VASGSSGHHMNVSFWINLALACVSPPIVKSHTDPLRKFRRPYMAPWKRRHRHQPFMETPEAGFDEPQLLVRRPQPARVAASPVCSSEQ
jgi:hypothetical protein